MTQTTAGDGKDRALTVPRVLAALVRQARDRRGWSGEQLAERCGEAGMPTLDRSTIANIETGRRRRIGIDEWLVLAQVLDVAPIHLLLPRGDDEVAVTPGVTVTVERAREWLVGREPLPGTDERTFRYEVPDSEHERRNQRVQDADERVRLAEHRLRVARAKLETISRERGELDDPAVKPFFAGALTGKFTTEGAARLDRRLDVAYDQVAEAEVALDDARADQQRVYTEEGV